MNIPKQMNGKALKWGWEYRGTDGEIMGVTCRYEPETPDGTKEVIPFFNLDSEGWNVGGPKNPKPLYGLDSIIQSSDQPIFVVEGEKAASAIHQMKLQSVTSIGGSNAAKQSDWSPLSGREVVILPDNDEPGGVYAADVQEILKTLGVFSSVCKLPGLPDKGDIVDWIQNHIQDWDGYRPDNRIPELRDMFQAEAKSSIVAGQTWPDLVPLDDFNTPQLDCSCLPGWLGDMVRALSDATETPVELAAGMTLATCSAAVARSVNVLVKPGYYEPCNLWIFASLPPGNRKSSVQSTAVKPLNDWQSTQAEILGPEIKRIASDIKTKEARAAELRRQSARSNDSRTASELAMQVAEIEADIPDVLKPAQLWTSDATPEKLGMLLADQAECMAWMSSEGGLFDMFQGRYSGGIPNLDLLLKSHSGDPETVDRGSRPPVHLIYPRLTIGLSPQPEVLRGLAHKPGFRGRGVLGRGLYLLPASPLGFRTFETNPVPDTVMNAYSEGIKAMLNWRLPDDKIESCNLHTLTLSPAAFEKWNEFALEIELQMRPSGRMEHVTDWAGKAPGAAARLAGILHCVEHAHRIPWGNEISESTMLKAVKIMRVITQHSLIAFDLMGADPAVAAARRVWDWIKRHGHAVFSVSEAFNALRGSFPRVKGLTSALEVLEERGYVEVLQTEHSGKPGRPRSPSVIVRPEFVTHWK